MRTKITTLDHGFVKLLNISGPVRRHNQPFDADDIDPAITARISFDNMDEVRARELDLKLVDYLIRNQHTTPIEMIEVWLEMKLPIFLARQFVRHRTAAINEVSGRYVTLPEEWYIPEIIGGKAANVKQGQEDNLPQSVQDNFKEELNEHCRIGFNDYLTAIHNGVAPEHARLLLSLNHYTHWVWKQDLHNLMHFMRLRLNPHAQIEARIYAQAIHDLLDESLPESMALFRKYRL